ncbi:ORF1036 [White spot syndrome virus]|uniref:ORF1036 n=1 Tax=White spot syndrome virus TaxID=342409 RepID=A0A2D3I692_9VIRU|nr:ORF1036 [White spot syndrome virus]
MSPWYRTNDFFLQFKEHNPQQINHEKILGCGLRLSPTDAMLRKCGVQETTDNEKDYRKCIQTQERRKYSGGCDMG